MLLDAASNLSSGYHQPRRRKVSTNSALPGDFRMNWMGVAWEQEGAGIAIEVLTGIRCFPFVVTGQEGTLLAAVLVYVGR